MLRLVGSDERWVQSFVADWRTAVEDPAERAMLTFVEKLTLTPGAMSEGDTDALRSAGFDDPGIFQITVIAGYFAYLNRVADALGIGR